MDKGMTMQGLGAVAIGILGLIVVFSIIPIVGDQMDQAIVIPGTCNNATEYAVDGNGACPESGRAPGAAWNSTMNTGIPTGISLWTSLGGILKVGAIVIVIAGFLRTLQGMRS